MTAVVPVSMARWVACCASQFPKDFWSRCRVGVVTHWSCPACGAAYVTRELHGGWLLDPTTRDEQLTLI